MPTDPDVEISVIIYQARNLASKKKGKKGKYSVIFGIGTKKFRTDIEESESGNPIFNQESVLPATSYKHPLKLVVTDRENVIGALIIELDEIADKKGLKQFAPLREYKKSGPACGELEFVCWVSKNNIPGDSTLGHKFSFSSSPPKKIGGKLKDRILSSDAIGKIRKNSFKGSLTNIFKDKRGTKSSYDLSTLSPGDGGLYRSDSLYSLDDEYGDLERHGSVNSHGSFHVLEDADDKTPKITGISPMIGGIDGGTRITIRGSNLGGTKEDVIGLFICGANCLTNIEYESPKKLFCTTKPWKVSSGYIVVVTQSGGRGCSTVQFEFVDNATDEAKLENSSFNNNDLSVAYEKNTIQKSGSFAESDIVDGKYRPGSSPQPIPKMKESLNPFTIGADDVIRTPSPKEEKYSHKHTLSVSSNTFSVGSAGSDDYVRPHSVSESEKAHNISLTPSPETSRRKSYNYFMSVLKPGDKEKSHHKSLPRVYSDRDLLQANITPPSTLEKPEGKRRGSLMPWMKDKAPSLTKTEMMSEITKMRFDTENIRNESDRLKLENEELRAENTNLREANSMIHRYLDRILTKVISECPHILDISTT